MTSMEVMSIISSIDNDCSQNIADMLSCPYTDIPHTISSILDSYRQDYQYIREIHMQGRQPAPVETRMESVVRHMEDSMLRIDALLHLREHIHE